MKRFSQTIKVMMALFVGIFANGTLTSATAYAATPDESARPGRYQQVFCNLEGQSGKWKAQIGGPSTEHEFPLIVNGAPVYVHDQNDVTAEMDQQCQQQYGTIRVTAVNGSFTDTCGTSFNLVFTPAQTTGVTYVQARVGNTITVTAVAQTGYTLTNPSWSQSATDMLKACPPVVIQIPTAPAPNDPCGLHNATWVLPSNTASYTWSIVNGHLIVTTTQGYVFSGNKTSFDYGVAPDSNKLCVVDVPQKPQQEDPCGSHNAHWILPSDTDQINWSLNQYGELTATAKPGYIFSNGKTVLYFGKAIDSNTPCIIVIKAPKAPEFKDPCGLNNAYWIIPKDTMQIDWSLNQKGELIATAKPGYIFENEQHSINFGKAVDSGKLCHAAPEAPVFVDYCGTHSDYIIIPSVKGVVYKIDGTKASAGYHAVNGTVVITAGPFNDDYDLVGDNTGPWTFTSTDTDCVTITKKSQPVTDTNNDGAIGVGDTVTWNITVTNNSSNDLDNFRIELNDSSATIVDNDYVTNGVIKYLKHGTSVTVTATSILNTNDVKACKATNVVTFQGWYTYKHHEIDRDGYEKDSFSFMHGKYDHDEDESDISGTSNVATAEFACPTPGSGNGGSTTTTTSTTSETPSELPATGPSDSNPMIIFAGSALAYIVTYLIQRRRELSATN